MELSVPLIFEVHNLFVCGCISHLAGEINQAAFIAQYFSEKSCSDFGAKILCWMCLCLSAKVWQIDCAKVREWAQKMTESNRSHWVFHCLTSIESVVYQVNCNSPKDSMNHQYSKRNQRNQWIRAPCKPSGLQRWSNWYVKLQPWLLFLFNSFCNLQLYCLSSCIGDGSFTISDTFTSCAKVNCSCNICEPMYHISQEDNAERTNVFRPVSRSVRFCTMINQLQSDNIGEFLRSLMHTSERAWLNHSIDQKVKSLPLSDNAGSYLHHKYYYLFLISNLIFIWW